MRLLLVIAVLLFSVAGFPTASDAGHRGHDRARDAMRSGQIRPLDQILSVVTSRYPGRVVDVDLRRGRRWVYRVKLLRRDGRVMWISVDARSGQILSAKGGRR